MEGELASFQIYVEVYGGVWKYAEVYEGNYGHMEVHGGMGGLRPRRRVTGWVNGGG